jgi:hypothetical protein
MRYLSAQKAGKCDTYGAITQSGFSDTLLSNHSVEEGA